MPHTTVHRLARMTQDALPSVPSGADIPWYVYAVVIVGTGIGLRELLAKYLAHRIEQERQESDDERTERKRLIAEVTQLREQIAELREQVGHLTASLESREGRVAELEQQRDHLQALNEQLEAELNARSTS